MSFWRRVGWAVFGLCVALIATMLVMAAVTSPPESDVHTGTTSSPEPTSDATTPAAAPSLPAEPSETLPAPTPTTTTQFPTMPATYQPPLAIDVLDFIEVKGRAAKTGYDRVGMFGESWFDVDGNDCDTRNDILARDLVDTTVDEHCRVVTGTLHDPFTGQTIAFRRGAETSPEVQVDHVVALMDAWQKGAQQLTEEERIVFANDPLNLLAVSGAANQQKGAGDAATWLPPNKEFRCDYVARQVAVKIKYDLWMTGAEKDASRGILEDCPGQRLPS